MVPVPVPLVVSVSVYGPFSVNCAGFYFRGAVIFYVFYDQKRGV